MSELTHDPFDTRDRTPSPTTPPDAQAMTRAEVQECDREAAAQCWCDPTTSMIEMDERLAEVFAAKLATERETIRRLEGQRDKLNKLCTAHERIEADLMEQVAQLQARLTASEAAHKDDLRHYQASIMQLLRLVTPAPMESWKQSVIDKANHLLGMGPLTPGKE